MRAASACRWLTMMFLSSRVGDGHDHGRHPQQACRDAVQPSIADRPGQAFVGAPVAGQSVERRFVDAQIVGHIVADEHGVVGQQAGVFDMGELLEHTQGGAGRTIGDQTPASVPTGRRGGDRNRRRNAPPCPLPTDATSASGGHAPRRFAPAGSRRSGHRRRCGWNPGAFGPPRPSGPCGASDRPCPCRQRSSRRAPRPWPPWPHGPIPPPSDGAGWPAGAKGCGA